jgi:hypothetical protein
MWHEQWCFGGTFSLELQRHSWPVFWVPGEFLEHSRLQRAGVPSSGHHGQWAGRRFKGSQGVYVWMLVPLHSTLSGLSRMGPLRSQAGTDTVFVYLRHFHSIFSLSLTACLQWVPAVGQFPSAVSSWVTALARPVQYSIYLGRNYSIFCNLLLSRHHSTVFTPVKGEKCLFFPPATLHFMRARGGWKLGWQKATGRQLWALCCVFGSMFSDVIPLCLPFSCWPRGYQLFLPFFFWYKRQDE